jgi:phosphatidylserine decarboxylase
MISHQFIDRLTGHIQNERLYYDRLIAFFYDVGREWSPVLFKTITSPRSSAILGYLNYDWQLGCTILGLKGFVEKMGIDLSECLEPLEWYDTPRKIFERTIRYWEVRPMDHSSFAIGSPADARILFGSFRHNSLLFLKEKFFDFEELLGPEKSPWLEAFTNGDYAILRLTPEKYHYNHVPVSGIVLDQYAIDGAYHSCNPSAVVTVDSMYSKNKRIVTIIDTDVPQGSGVGLVAMIEVVALMIGDIVQCYSDQRYENPQSVVPGMFLRKGQPKSLYRPGSSTDVVIFQRGKIRPCRDLLHNMCRRDVQSRFSEGFGKSLVETDVQVRSTIAYASDFSEQEERGS